MKSIYKALVILIFTLAFAASASSQVYVRVVPRPPVHVRPPCPQPGYVWIDGGWFYNGRHYVWQNGYWGRPPHRYHQWIPGHWRDTPYGFRWVPGHWR
jgi:hypothetical protein